MMRHAGKRRTGIRGLKGLGAALLFAFVFLAPFRGWAQQTTTGVVSDTLNNFDDAFRQLKDEREALHKELQSLKSEQRTMVDGVRQRLEDVEEEKEQTSAALETAQQRITDLEVQKEALAQRLDEKRMAMDNYGEVISGKEAKVADVRGDNEKLRLELQDSEQALQAAGVQIRKLKEENQSLQDENSLLSDQRKKILFGYDDELVAIKQQRERLIEQLRDAQQKLKIAEKRSAGADDQEGALRKKYQQQIEDLMADNKTLEQKLQEFQKDKGKSLKKREEEVADLQKKQKAWEKKLEDAQDTIKGLQQQLVLADEKAALAVKQADGFEKEREDYKGELSALRLKLQQLRDEKQLAADEAKGYQEKFRETQEKWAQAQQKVEEASRKHEADLSDASLALKSAQDRIVRLQGEKDDLLGKMDKINSQLLEYNSAITKNIALEKDNKLLRGGMDDTVKKLNAAEKKYEDSQAQYQNEKAQWDKLRAQYESSLDLIEEAKGLKEKNQSLFEASKAYETKLKNLLDSFVKLQQENDELKDASKSKVSSKAHDEALRRTEVLEQENTALKLEVNKMRERMKALNEEYNESAKDRMVQDRKIEKMDSHLKDWDKEKEEWEKAHRESLALLADKEATISDMRDALRKTLDENSRLQAQADEYPRSLASVNRRLEQLEKENALLHYNLGVIYTEKEMYPEAVKEFEKTLGLKSDESFAHYNLGIIYSQYLIDEKKAVQHFSSYLKNAPNDKDADMARRYLVTREKYESER